MRPSSQSAPSRLTASPTSVRMILGIWISSGHADPTVTVECRFSHRSKIKTHAADFTLGSWLFLEENCAIIGSLSLSSSLPFSFSRAILQHPRGITRNRVLIPLCYLFLYREILVTVEYGMFILHETSRAFGEIARGDFFHQSFIGSFGRGNDCRLSVRVHLLSLFRFVISTIFG